jgi:hypothetical protein
MRFAFDAALADAVQINLEMAAETPEEALARVLQSAGLAFRMLNGIYVIVPATSPLPDKITGVVIDSVTGESVPYAVVYLKEINKVLIAGPEGFFQYKGRLPEVVIAQITSIGYTPKLCHFAPSARALPVEVKMNPACSQLEEVTICYTNKQTVGLTQSPSSFTLNPEQIRAIPQIGEPDIFRSLQFLPGINASNESSAGLYIRGSQFDYNMVALDGIPLYHLDHFLGVFGALNSDFVKDVRVYQSGYPARYGGRISGIVEVTGKTGSRTKPAMSLSANLLSAHMALESPIGKEMSVVATWRRSYTHLYQSPVYNTLLNSLFSGQDQTTILVGSYMETIRHTTLPDLGYYDLNARVTYHPTGNQNLVLSFYKGRDTYTLLDSIASINFSSDRNKNIHWGNTGASLHYTLLSRNSFIHRLVASISDFSSSYYCEEDVSAFLQTGQTVNQNKSEHGNNTIFNTYLKYETEWLAFSHHKPVMGIEIARHKTSLESGDDSYHTSILKNAGELATFFQDEMELSNHWRVNAGIRVTGYDGGSNLFFDPRMILSFDVSKSVTLHAACTRHHQIISKSLSSSNPTPRYESWILADSGHCLSATHYVAGVKLTRAKLSASIEGYHIRSKGIGIMDWSVPADPTVFSSQSGEGQSSGIDLFVRKTYRMGETWLSYSYCSSQMRFKNINFNRSFPASMIQQHELKVMNTFTLKRFDFSLSWVFGNGKPWSRSYVKIPTHILFNTPVNFIQLDARRNNYTLPAYHRLDAALNYHFKAMKCPATAGISLINLYGRKNLKNKQYRLQKIMGTSGSDALMIREENTYSPGMFVNVFLKISLE